MTSRKPKEFRDILFKKDRPNIRPLEIYTDSGIGKDMGILWAAYKKGSFLKLPADLDKDEFSILFENIVSQYTKGWIIEDSNASFSDNYGAVGFVLAVSNDWELEPHFEKFSWSTKRNTLRSCVSFFQMMKYNKDIGIVNVLTSDNDDKRYFKKLNKYGVLNFVGTVPKGDINGDRHIFYVKGKKKWAA